MKISIPNLGVNCQNFESEECTKIDGYPYILMNPSIFKIFDYWIITISLFKWSSFQYWICIPWTVWPFEYWTCPVFESPQYFTLRMFMWWLCLFLLIVYSWFYKVKVRMAKYESYNVFYFEILLEVSTFSLFS
jgi:hypothetical protein